MRIKSVGYMRTSSISNLSTEKLGKDSDRRQKKKILDYSKSNNLEVVEWFYDKGISGSLDILNREGFVSLLDYCDRNEIKMILVENSSRFSRSLICSITGFQYLTDIGINLVSVESPTMFLDTEEPTYKLVRDVLTCIDEFDKNRTVMRLKGSRERLRETRRKEGKITSKGTGKTVGRLRSTEKTYNILNEKGDIERYLTGVELEKLIRKYKNEGLSYEKISKRLFNEGIKSSSGNPLSTSLLFNTIKYREIEKKEKKRRDRKKNSTVPSSKTVLYEVSNYL